MLNRSYVKVISLLLVILSLFSCHVSAETIVSIEPHAQVIDRGQNFIVDVHVQSDEPVSGIEFDLLFNGSVVHAISMEEGDLFKQGGGNTIFNSGSIDNDNGTFTDVYGLILGKANVTGSGVFATISFRSQDVDESCTLSLSNLVVSNSTGSRMPVSVIDGSVTVGDLPQVSDEIPQSSNEESSAEGLDQNSALILCFAAMVLLVFRRKR